jgi:hypothetical protein
VQPLLEAPGAEGHAHAVDDALPGRGVDVPAQAAVGHDLDAVLGQQQVDQHAVVVLGVPDAQLAEQRDARSPRASGAPQVDSGSPASTQTRISPLWRASLARTRS